MSRINRLTPEQEATFPSYVDEWLRVGLSTETDRCAAEAAVRRAYECAGLKPPGVFVWLRSPLEGTVGSYMLSRVRDQVWDHVGTQVWDKVWGQVWDEVMAQVRDQVWDQVGAQVRDQVWDEVLAQVWNQVRAQVWAQVWDQVGSACYGSHDASWLVFYRFFHDNGIEMPILDGLWEAARHCGWWWPFRGCAILTPKPGEVHLRDGVLHHDGGPAIRYEDGFSVWALNGVRVPQWLAETPAHEIDPARFMEIQNVEVRREFVRKVDVTRVFDRVARIIDTQGDYALGEFEVVNGQPRRYLKMLNPSVPGVWHIEAVHPSCATVAEALNWRRYGNTQITWAPSQLS